MNIIGVLSDPKVIVIGLLICALAVFVYYIWNKASNDFDELDRRTNMLQRQLTHGVVVDDPKSRQNLQVTQGRDDSSDGTLDYSYSDKGEGEGEGEGDGEGEPDQEGPEGQEDEGAHGTEPDDWQEQQQGYNDEIDGLNELKDEQDFLYIDDVIQDDGEITFDEAESEQAESEQTESEQEQLSQQAPAQAPAPAPAKAPVPAPAPVKAADLKIIENKILDDIKAIDAANVVAPPLPVVGKTKLSIRPKEKQSVQAQK